MIFINRRTNRNNNNNTSSNTSFNPVSVMPIVNMNPQVKKIEPQKPIKKERVKEMLWGEPTWFLFHTLAEKIKETHFAELKNKLVSFIKQICNNLPCPECAQHATQYINGVNFDAIRNKSQLKILLHTFHNTVNNIKGYDKFDYTDIDKYNNAITINIIKNFFHHFGKKHYSVRMDISGHQRSIILRNFRKWLEENHYCFEE
jgi:hypothetical protein